MNKKLKTILRLGAILSLVIILISALSYVFDLNKIKWLDLLNSLIFIFCIVLVQKYYRNNFYDGFITYSKMLGGTLLILLVSSFIRFIYTFLFYKFIAPEQIAKMLNEAEINMFDTDLTESQINSSVSFLKNYIFTPISISITTTLMTFLQGFFIALISSIFTKKNPDAYSEAMRGVDNE